MLFKALFLAIGLQLPRGKKDMSNPKIFLNLDTSIFLVVTIQLNFNIQWLYSILGFYISRCIKNIIPIRVLIIIEYRLLHKDLEKLSSHRHNPVIGYFIFHSFINYQ